MGSFTRKLRDKFKGNKSPQPLPNPTPADSQAAANTADAALDPARLPEQAAETHPKDLWEAAYKELSDKDRWILSQIRATRKPASLCASGHHGEMADLVDKVIESTEQKYQDYQKGGVIERGPDKQDINIRDAAHKTLDAALSFKDLISAAVAFDPTGHASSVWTLVSFGLTMTKNHIDIKAALFESSALLTDALARCVFVVKNHYNDNNFETKDQLGNALKQLYKDILRYTVQVEKSLQAGGKKIWECISPVANHPLKGIESAIKTDEDRLQQWVGHNEHLQHRSEAQSMLAKIDEVFDLIKDLHRQLDLSRLPDVEEASFDHHTRQFDDKCVSGTRKELLAEIDHWASSQGPCMFWLSGQAGTGKSTISRTVAQTFKDRGELGASFFFKRGEGDCGTAARFFSTITRQLLNTVPEIIPAVSEAIKDDHGISNKPFNDQFEKLLLQPLRGLDLGPHKVVRVVVLDALDECYGDNNIKLLLELLPKMQQSTSVKIKIFLTSRPELPIRIGFRQIAVDAHRDFQLHRIDGALIRHDISLFLNDQFKKIRKDYLLRGRELPEDWPKRDEIEKLTNIAVPLFIIAATFCRFIKQRSPPKRLSGILNDPFANSATELERTYMPVLNQINIQHDTDQGQQQLQEFRKIVGAIVLLFSPLPVNSLVSLMDLDRDEIDINDHLENLHSVLYVPSGAESQEPVRLLHLSFREFLVSPRHKYSVDEKAVHLDLTKLCLRVMRQGLKKNICDLESEGVERTEIDREILDHHITAELRYSCRYWTQHLASCKEPCTEMDDVLVFLQQHFLHWAEAMCILGHAFEVVWGIERLQSLVNNTEKRELSEFLRDARRFILKNRHIADIAPLQLYASGLIFAPTESIIRKVFGTQIPKWISKLPKVQETWDAELVTLESHCDSVFSIAFSPDGQLLASGGSGRTIEIWDLATGALNQNFQDHGCVSSLSFSPNGKLLVSVSTKGIRVWDLATGTLCRQRQELEGHHSVAVSSDVQWLVSEFRGNISIWDLTTGTLHRSDRTFGDQNYMVTSVVISSDGQWLASGSCDMTIRIWDLTTGTLHQTLNTNSEVEPLAFSPNEKWLATGTPDGTIKIWDPVIGTLHQTLENCDKGIGITSVAFSSDGKWLASFSLDNIIRIWDLVTGTLHQILEGHTATVQAVAFAPDRQLLASCSYDGTVRFWDPTTKHLHKPFRAKGHDGPVNSVAFSPNGQLLASGSQDKTIKIWDQVTDTLHSTLEGHNNWVEAVSFSSDGQWLVSGSSDKTIKVWDLTSGTLHQKLRCSYTTTGWVTSVAFSLDRQWLASSYLHGAIDIWELAIGTVHQTLEDHGNDKLGVITSVAFSPDGKWLVSGSSDKTIEIWDLTTSTGTLHQTLEGQYEWSNSVGFSLDGPHLQITLGTSIAKSLDSSDKPIQNQTPPKIELCIRNEEWVALQGRKVLLLPYDYRPLCTAITNGTLAMGHDSGHISLLEFCL